MERFIGVLTEHFAAPSHVAGSRQVMLLTVTTPRFLRRKVYQRLIESGIRAEKDFRNEKLGLKSGRRNSRRSLHGGDRRPGSQTGDDRPRARTGKTLSRLKVEEFIQKIKEETIIGGESYR